MFGRKDYRKVCKDGPETLKVKGTKLSCTVLSIRESKEGLIIKVSPILGLYADKVYTTTVPKLREGIYVGSVCNMYLDEVDADGDFYVEVD